MTNIMLETRPQLCGIWNMDVGGGNSCLTGGLRYQKLPPISNMCSSSSRELPNLLQSVLPHLLCCSRATSTLPPHNHWLVWAQPLGTIINFSFPSSPSPTVYCPGSLNFKLHSESSTPLYLWWLMTVAPFFIICFHFFYLIGHNSLSLNYFCKVPQYADLKPGPPWYVLPLLLSPVPGHF